MRIIWKALPEAGPSGLMLPHIPLRESPAERGCPTQSRAATAFSCYIIFQYCEVSQWKPNRPPSVLASIYTNKPASGKHTYSSTCPKWRSSAGTPLSPKTSFPSFRLRERSQREVQTIDDTHWTAMTALLAAVTPLRRPSRWIWKAPYTSIRGDPGSGESCMIPASASGSQAFWD